MQRRGEACRSRGCLCKSGWETLTDEAKTTRSSASSCGSGGAEQDVRSDWLPSGGVQMIADDGQHLSDCKLMLMRADES